MGIRHLICRGDTDLVVQQVMKTFDTKDSKMVAYCAAVRDLKGKFDGLELHDIKRSDNMAAACEPVPDETFLEILHKPSVKLRDIATHTATSDESEPPTTTQAVAGNQETTELMQEATKDDEPVERVFTVIPDWTQPLLAYLVNGDLPEEKKEARRIVCKSKAYTVIKGELYKRSLTGIYQCCVSEEGQWLLEEIHAGACGYHAAPWTIVGKAFCHRFFWPHAMRNKEKIVRTCDGCEHFAQKTHMPATALNTLDMAICHMGPRHGGTSVLISRRSQVPPSCY